MGRTIGTQGNIHSVEYDAAGSVLRVRFHSGAVYQHSNVSEAVYKGLLDSKLRNEYYDAYIKYRYPYRRILIV